MAFTWSDIKNRWRRLVDFAGRRRALYAEWEKLAEQGDEEAKYRLLMLYRDEKPDFYAQAFKWTMDVARQGDDCCVLLQAAQMFEAGHGTAQDNEQALLWFERALSLHILRGNQSPLSAGATNYLQQRIQTLRAKLGRN